MISQNKRAIFFHLGVKKMSWQSQPASATLRNIFEKDLLRRQEIEPFSGPSVDFLPDLGNLSSLPYQVIILNIMQIIYKLLKNNVLKHGRFRMVTIQLNNSDCNYWVHSDNRYCGI